MTTNDPQLVELFQRLNTLVDLRSGVNKTSKTIIDTMIEAILNQMKAIIIDGPKS